MGARLIEQTPERAARILRGVVVTQLIRKGWRPPPLTDVQAGRLLDDMARLGDDARHVQARSDSLSLTAHEQRVLRLVADGCSAPEIARRLDRAPDTIKKLEARIRGKLGARNNAHAVALAGYRVEALADGGPPG